MQLRRQAQIEPTRVGALSDGLRYRFAGLDEVRDVLDELFSTLECVDLIIGQP